MPLNFAFSCLGLSLGSAAVREAGAGRGALVELFKIIEFCAKGRGSHMGFSWGERNVALEQTCIQRSEEKVITTYYSCQVN